MPAVLTSIALAFSGCIDSSGLSDAACRAVCNGVCVDTQRDLTNCGACGNVCPSGQSCVAGVCGGCSAGDTSCVCPPVAPNACGTGPSAVCTDVKTDANNCGTCGNVCAPPLACAGGVCVTASPRQSVALLAGQIGSWGNLDGIGTEARFNGPWAVCQDGNALLVADDNNCVIRKVDIATGATTTVAGFMNSCGDVDGVGVAARLSNPSGCALDGAGNMFVTERGGGCLVRKIELATATVSTVAGLSCDYADGAGSAARFRNPQGIAYDGAANLYISDSSNNAIRKLAIANGAVTTLAGPAAPSTASGSTDASGADARFNAPQGLHVDRAAGFLYVTDFNNHTLRRVALSGGAVVTVVGVAGQAAGTDGTGTEARLRSPVGVAFDGTDKLYVTENDNHDVRVVSLTNFAVTTNAGAAGVSGYADGSGSGALFFNPRGLAFDASGNYYIADYGNHAIRKVVAATGTVTTVAGLGAAFGSTDGAGATATFNYPYGLAFDGTDTLYVSDYAAGTIRSISISKGTVSTIAGTAGATGNVDGTGAGARFSSPSGIALDGSGNLYVADRNNHTIRKVVLATGSVTTIAGSAGTGGYQEGAGSAALFRLPVAVAFDGGNLYVAENENRVVRVVPLGGGSTTTLAGAPAVNAVVDGVGENAGFSNITGIAAKDGKVYVADTNRIRVIDAATGSVASVTGSGGFSDGIGAYANFNFNGQPGLLSFDTDGSLLVADFYNALIRRFSPTTWMASTIAGINGSYGAALGPLPKAIATSPRAAVAIPNGLAFAANYGVFTIR